jgi:hypothetical protein
MSAEEQKNKAEVQQMQKFYETIVRDLKQQIGDLADQKAVQVAFNAQKEQMIQLLQQSNQEKDEKLKELEEKLLKDKAE